MSHLPLIPRGMRRVGESLAVWRVPLGSERTEFDADRSAAVALVGIQELAARGGRERQNGFSKVGAGIVWDVKRRGR